MDLLMVILTAGAVSLGSPKFHERHQALRTLELGGCFSIPANRWAAAENQDLETQQLTRRIKQTIDPELEQLRYIPSRYENNWGQYIPLWVDPTILIPKGFKFNDGSDKGMLRWNDVCCDKAVANGAEPADPFEVCPVD